MSRRPARLRVVLAWLLTPVAAWAASFGGAWVAARLTGGLIPLLVGGLLGAGLGAWVWLALVSRVAAVPPPDQPERS